MKRAKKTGFILGVCMVALLLGGSMITVQAQSNVPAALESFDGLDESVWERVSEPGFGNDDNISVVAMAEYEGRLYAVTRNEIEGAEVWRTADEGWEQVVFPDGHTNGAWGNKRLGNLWSDMLVFQDWLYVAFSGGLKGEGLKSTGCEIWRFDGSTWEPVISNRADTEERGSITAVSDCSAEDSATTAVFIDSTKSWLPDQWQGGVLQIQDDNGLWRPFEIISNTADSLTVQQNETEGDAQGVEYTICADQPMTVGFPPYSYELGAVGPGSTYEIGTGSDESGFGDPWNKTITDMEEFEGQLYVATGLNSEYGAQVWRTSDGDAWEVIAPARSLGLFHSGPTYLNGQKPVCSSITSLCKSSVSGEPVLYAGAAATFGDQGNGSRMARLTSAGWELIVDKDVDDNDIGTNESGFGDGSSFNASYLAKLTGNFMPWSLADFDGKLMAGVMSLGGTRVMYSNDGSPDDGSWYYAVGGDSAIPEGFDGLVHPEPTLTSWGVYENIAAVLYPFGRNLYLGMLTLYEPGFDAYEHHMTGAEMWKTSDGITWNQVTDDGFGDMQTVAFEGFTNFNDQLYVSGSKGCTDADCGMAAAKIYRLAYAGSLQVDKCKVKAGKNGKGDSMQFSGSLDAVEADFDAAMGKNIFVSIKANNISDTDVTTFSFLINEDSFKKGKYKSPKVKSADKAAPMASLQIDSIKREVKFSGKKLDLTGLSCPIIITIQIGEYSAAMELDEDIVNGPKKPCPPELMEGI